jgi:hypothetical protein
MIIPIDREMKIVLLEALKTGILDTLKIPALYGKQLNYFMDIMIEAGKNDEAGNENKRSDVSPPPAKKCLN